MSQRMSGVLACFESMSHCMGLEQIHSENQDGIWLTQVNGTWKMTVKIVCIILHIFVIC